MPDYAQYASSSTAFSGEVPANLQCGFCKAPIQGAFYRTFNRFACENCVKQISGVIEKNVAVPGPLLKASAAGLVVAAVCAAAWAAIVQITHYQIGIVASFIGVAVGKAVFIASDKRRGHAYQVIAALFSVVGILGGKLLLTGWQVADELSRQNLAATPIQIVRIVIKFTENDPSAVFNAFDLLWVGIAVYAAWRICKAPQITVAGPFPLNPTSTNPMQFDTVEHVDPVESSDLPEAH